MVFFAIKEQHKKNNTGNVLLVMEPNQFHIVIAPVICLHTFHRFAIQLLKGRLAPAPQVGQHLSSRSLYAA